jgi:diguanylate cyclase (GGDEF)-like protein
METCRPSARLSSAVPRARAGCAALLVAVALLASPHPGATADGAGADRAASAPARGRAPYVPADELERLEYLSRAQPEVALPALLHLADTVRHDDARLLDVLMVVGTRYVDLGQAEEAEAIARRIEALKDRVPAARAAALLLRGQWFAHHGEIAHAQRQLIEARALLPADAPLALRIRLLATDGDVENRRGHFDEAMSRYNAAMRLADAAGLPWRRGDMRNLAVSNLIDAGQLDKAAALNAEQMRIARDAGDEFGMAAATNAQANLLSEGPDAAATLAAWRGALEHARLAGSKRGIAIGYANIADYYLTHDDYPTAYEMAMRGLSMAREIRHEGGQAVALSNIGLALISMKRKDEGLAYLREATALEERSGSAREIAEGAKELGTYLEKAGYARDALAAYNRYRQLAGELYQKDRERALVELQEGFENERRQHELDMLASQSRLKDEEILHDDLQLKQWTAAGVSGLLLLAIVAALSRRLRLRNRQLRASNEELRVQAEIDPLTGLANRHHLQALMAARPSPVLEGTLYLIDIDHFKRINDRHGHAGGDAVLKEVARRLRATLRDDDVVVRWGGEEFLVLVRTLPLAESEALAQRLLAALARRPVTYEGVAIAVSASIGHGVFPLRRDGGPAIGPAEHALGWEAAIGLADRAMYLAKTLGRNRACGLRAVRAADAQALADTAGTLEAAWRDGRVDLHLQPGPAIPAEPAVMAQACAVRDPDQRDLAGRAGSRRDCQALSATVDPLVEAEP